MAWKVAVLVALVAAVSLLELGAVEGQSMNCTDDGGLEFRFFEVSRCGPCAAHANCHYSSDNGYYCACGRGWRGDGYFGCRRSRLRTWQVVVAIIGAILGALLILFLCLACIRSCLLRRRSRGHFVQQPGDPVYRYPQQPYPPQAYPQQGVPLYETNKNQKVPEPAGVV